MIGGDGELTTPEVCAGQKVRNNHVTGEKAREPGKGLVTLSPILNLHSKHACNTF